MELFLELAVLTILNVHTVDWLTQFTSVIISNIVSVSLLTILCGSLVFYMARFMCYPKQLRIKEFGLKFLPLLDGTKWNHKEPNWNLIFVPVIFFTKRLLIACTIISAKDYLWVQITSLHLMNLISAIYTLQCSPLATKKSHAFEVFNDCTLLVLTYCLLCFTDFIPEEDTRHKLGYVFITVSLGNIALHLVFILLETFLLAKLRCKRRINLMRAGSKVHRDRSANKKEDKQKRAA